MLRRFLLWSVVGMMFMPAGCRGVQSTLDPAGPSAERIAALFWWMAGGAALVWGLVIGLGIYSLMRPESHRESKAKLYIIGGGAAFPTVALAVLLIYGLPMLPELMGHAREGSLKIAVSGEQWWWRVRYFSPAGEAVELANEIRLPVGEPVEFRLDSPDVIHSFWIPALGGKVDMIPGRVNRLVLEATRVGTYRGVCAEYCGSSHALMAFPVVVMEKEAFAAWLEAQAAPAMAPSEALPALGHEFFLGNGCGACHTIRGTAADGVIGPDLTHVGSRLTLGAGILPNDRSAYVHWIGHTERVKPGVLMPAFGMLPPEQLDALAVYLEGLE